MSITIPDDIRYNRRDYSIGDVLELNDSMLGEDPQEHPIFKLMLHYIASPFSTNDYNTIEDNLKYFLDIPFMTNIANTDKDMEFDEDEYKKHIDYANDKLMELTIEQLLNHLIPYVGETDNLKWTLKHGLLDVGKNVKVEEINTEIGTDHLLSAHSKGIESKKIFQAGDKKKRYEPALDDINEILSDEKGDANRYIKVEVNTPQKIKIHLPKAKKPSTYEETIYTIDIDFEALFEKLYMDANIRPTGKYPKRYKQEEEQPTSQSTSQEDKDAALQEALDRSKKVKKSLMSILQKEEDYEFDEYKPHPDIQLDDDDKRILYHINLKLAWNKIHDEGVFESEDEDLGSLDSAEIERELKEGRMNEVVAIAKKLVEAGLIREATYNTFIHDSVPPKKLIVMDKPSEKKLLRKIIELKKEKDIPTSEFEASMVEQIGEKNINRQLKESDRRVSPIVHAPEYTSSGHKRLFIDDSWRTPKTVKLDLKNAKSYARSLREALYKEALIPREVGILRLTLSVVEEDNNIIEDRKKLLEDEDEDVRDNSKYLIEKVFNVFRLLNVDYIIKQEYDFTDWTERKPEYRPGSNPKAEKLRLRTRSLEPQDRLAGREPSGGQPTYVSVKSNTMLYYIKNQVSRLKGML